MVGVIAIIGAGAASCFGAVELKRRVGASARVCVFEAGPKAMAKLALTGGGRCNLTNSFAGVSRLDEVYPRGFNLMKRSFRYFDNEAVMAWFEKEGVRLVTQEDNCVFPVSQDAMQIVRCLERGMRECGVELFCEKRLTALVPSEKGFGLEFADGSSFRADKVLFAIGGTKRQKLSEILPAGIELTDTVPSLFTFKIPDEGLRALMGTVVHGAELALAGTKYRSRGPLLITDWGVSGPATLRLSSYAATYLARTQYESELIVNWLGCSEAEVRDRLAQRVVSDPKKQLSSVHPASLPDRLWRFLLSRAALPAERRWAELGTRGFNKLVSVLTADSYPIRGRAAFKEEFVTCGGVALSNINMNTMESKLFSGLFFAGEVLDIDALTGGFNLQAAWSTAKLAVDNM